MRFAIVVSRFNPEVTEGLLEGALAYLREQDVNEHDVDIFRAPGAFETPLIAQKLARLKDGQEARYSGVICLGAVIKGDTAHFEFISLSSSIGIMQAMLATETPIAFGIITTYNDEQAEARSRVEGPNATHNKGREAAAACLDTAKILASF
jgi:6,7-dimethyl-8-ribityllumazine synthase